MWEKRDTKIPNWLDRKAESARDSQFLFTLNQVSLLTKEVTELIFLIPGMFSLAEETACPKLAISQRNSVASLFPPSSIAAQLATLYTLPCGQKNLFKPSHWSAES
jgi:hypothetical protein